MASGTLYPASRRTNWNLLTNTPGSTDNIAVTVEAPTLDTSAIMMKHPSIHLLVATGGPGVVTCHPVDILKPSQLPLFIDPSYTQDLDHYNPHKCHKREEQAKESLSCEFSSSAL